ncbi:MAG: hypothetical protein AAF828_07175 [Bacteroidota bacterium]
MTLFTSFLHSSKLSIGWLTLLLFLSSCANYRLHYNGDDPVIETRRDDLTEYSTFFVGDLGYQPAVGLKTLSLMDQMMQGVNHQQSLLLLGDILGPEGLPTKDGAEAQYLDKIIDELADIPGKVYYTPGENELGRNGYFSHLKRLEKYLKKNSEKKIKVMPKKGCSGPDDDEIHPGIGLIGASTAWYLADWSNESEVSEGCDYNDRHDFLAALADEIKGYRDKVKIVMMHHPLASAGNRGGHYSFTQHLFPLADLIPGAYLPLPGVGSIVKGLHAVSGGRHDLSSLRYRDLVVKLLARTEDENNIIFLGGHEHNLHYTNGTSYHIVGAGSGSTKQPASGKTEASFAYGAIGFGRLDFKQAGSVVLRFYEVQENGKAQEVYRQTIIENRFTPAEPDLPPVIADPVTTPTVNTPVYETEAQARSGLYEGVWGRHYRSMYFQEVETPVLMIDTIHGGLTPYRRGGGQSTQSLHTRGGDGRLYQLRSVRKNVAQLLPNILERTFAADLARDQFTALHPYAPVTLPPMQRALGLLGADPTIYFVPKQPALGKFNSNYGGETYYLEQRADEDWSGTGFYADSENIISNSDMREEMSEDWKHRADQKNFLIARLFDFLIGDWDRHRDQWRWAEIDQPNGFKTYLPIARDRDQVYSNFDGALLSIVSAVLPDARKLRAFDEKLNKAKWRAQNGKWNDRFFLNELVKEDFIEAANYIRSKLTDELIDASLQAFPPEVRDFSLEQEDIDGKLKKRREQLTDFALEYYQELAKAVNITATNKDDYFRAKATPEGQLLIQLFDADKKGKADELYYERLFHPKETKEVRLYGLDGNDQFELAGDHKSPIRIRIIGGTDKDYAQTDGKLKAHLYDGKDGMEIKGKKVNLRDHRSDRHTILNQYKFEEHKADFMTPFPSFGFNVDDGLFFGMGVTIRKHGFKPDPYATNHHFYGSVSNNGTNILDYTGTFNNFFGRRADFIGLLNYRSPDFVVNFFGLGNETEGFDAQQLEFNRTRQQRISAFPQLRLRGKNSRLQFTIGPFYESFKVDRGDAVEEATLISQPGIVPERVFSRQDFMGVRAQFSMNNLALPNIPDNGIKLKLHAEQNNNLAGGRNFVKFGGAFTYYQFFGKQVIGLASRIGFEHIDGDFEFYQAAQLGGRTNFRSLRSERFLGNTVFFHNIDVRIRGFGISKNPSSVTGGFLFGADYGRVWLDGEDSDVWHLAYGGGLWYAPFNAIVLSTTYFTGKDGSRVNIGVGFPF